MEEKYERVISLKGYKNEMHLNETFTLLFDRLRVTLKNMNKELEIGDSAEKLGHSALRHELYC